jgi:asparagine synthase (glutamine-hydrolysing)
MQADRSLWLPDESLHSTDRASMAHGVEYRVPLLDQEVAMYADSFSVSQHLRFGKGKHMLWTAYKDKLPQHLFNQRKRGWLSPAAKWLRNPEVNSLVRYIMSDSYASNLSRLIDWTATERVLDQHCNQEVYALNPLWNILQLQAWAKAKGLHL